MTPEIQIKDFKTWIKVRVMTQNVTSWTKICFTSCRQQGKQQLPHFKGRVSVITSCPMLSWTWRTNERSGPQNCLLQQSFSSATKNTCCPILFFTVYLLLVSQPNITVIWQNKAKIQKWDPCFLSSCVHCINWPISKLHLGYWLQSCLAIAWQLLPTTILTDKPLLFSNSMEVCLGSLILQITEVTQKQGKILWLNKKYPERIHTVFLTYR